MAVVAGNKLVVKVSATPFVSPNDGVVIDNMDSATLNEAVEIIEINGFGDESKKRMAGIMDSDISLSGALNTTDAGQVQMRPGSSLYIGYFIEGLQAEGIQIPVIVEKRERKADVGGKQELSLTLLGNGELTPIPVA